MIRAVMATIVNINRLRSDVRRSMATLRKVEARITNEALVRTLNRTAAHARTVAVRSVTKEMGIVQRDVRAAVTIQRATRSRLEAVITARGKAIPLRRFRPLQTRRGVTASAWGRRRVYPGTFLAPLGSSGSVGVFKRPGGRRGGQRLVQSGENVGQRYRPELPIRQLWGPSVPRTFLERRVRVAIVKAIRAYMPDEFKRNVRYWTNRLRSTT